MKSIFLIAQCLFLVSILLSCEKGGLSPVVSETLSSAESDVVIHDLKITNTSSLKSGDGGEYQVSFKDETSGEDYSYVINRIADGGFSMTFENNGEVECMILRVVADLNDNFVITGKYDERDLITGIRIKTLQNGGMMFELNDDLSTFNSDLRAIVYESWWGCVKRITLDENVAMATIIASAFTGGEAAIAVAGAAGLICLRKSERLHHYE